jgi:hypothetical protein
MRSARRAGGRLRAERPGPIRSRPDPPPPRFPLVRIVPRRAPDECIRAVCRHPSGEEQAGASGARSIAPDATPSPSPDRWAHARKNRCSERPLEPRSKGAPRRSDRQGVICCAREASPFTVRRRRRGLPGLLIVCHGWQVIADCRGTSHARWRCVDRLQWVRGRVWHSSPCGIVRSTSFEPLPF